MSNFDLNWALLVSFCFNILRHVIFWSIRGERNQRVFDGIATPPGQFHPDNYFWDNEKICLSSLDAAECVDNLYFGCI